MFETKGCNDPEVQDSCLVEAIPSPKPKSEAPVWITPQFNVETINDALSISIHIKKEVDIDKLTEITNLIQDCANKVSGIIFPPRRKPFGYGDE